MSPEERARLRELARRATPGPWFTVEPPWGDGTWVNAGNQDPHGGTPVCDCDLVTDWPADEKRPDGSEDAAFIAAARTALPAALDALDERDRREAELVAAVAKLERGCDCEYDYRCGRCSALLRVKELAALAGRGGAG